jgi:hypothetical protein
MDFKKEFEWAIRMAGQQVRSCPLFLQIVWQVQVRVGEHHVNSLCTGMSMAEEEGAAL